MVVYQRKNKICGVYFINIEYKYKENRTSKTEKVQLL